MKLAILTSSLPPMPVGGAEYQALETARGLAARGHQVTIFARRMPPGSPSFEEVDGVRRVRSYIPPVPKLSFAGHLWNFRRDWARHGDGAEIILAYQTVINGVLGAMVAGRKCPLVTWLRNEEEYDYSGLKYRWLTPPVLRRSAHVLVQSRTLADGLLAAETRRVGADEAGRLAARLDAIPNAVRVGPEPPADGRHGLLAAGRLVPAKGHDVLLRALRSMVDPPPLSIVGEGPLRAELEAAAQGLPVTFLGYVRDLPERMAQHKLLVMPSRTEGFPNVVLEAMERGLPAVTTLVGALADVVIPGETGLVVPTDDAPALGQAITQVYHDPDALARMGRRSREVALGYGWESHLDRLEALFRDVVAKHGS